MYREGVSRIEHRSTYETCRIGKIFCPVDISGIKCSGKCTDLILTSRRRLFCDLRLLDLNLGSYRNLRLIAPRGFHCFFYQLQCPVCINADSLLGFCVYKLTIFHLYFSIFRPNTHFFAVFLNIFL